MSAMGAGVRARQEHVAFAMCDDPAQVDRDVRPLLGARPLSLPEFEATVADSAASSVKGCC